MINYDVIIIGGGPAGLAAAIAANKQGAKTLIIEREGRLGGILKQCIHDGFGLIRFGEKLSGPEYAERYMEEVKEASIDTKVWSFVTAIDRQQDQFVVTIVNREGLTDISCKSLILATGCRERTAKQVFIHGTRPAGVFTAGSAQHFTNILGQLPTKKCVILGSGDIGLIMARRLTLEGAKVIGVYEAKATPSGLTRNLVQCLEDYNIPLHLAHTVTRVYGYDRLTGVEISQVNEHMKPIPGTAYDVACDGLILSVGLIPENEVAENLGVTLDPRTKGPRCNTSLMTDVPGVFSCGNALHVNDLVDYVSESGEIAGLAAALYATNKSQNEKKKEMVEVIIDSSIAYIVPQVFNVEGRREKEIFYFRTRVEHKKATFTITVDGNGVYEKKLTNLKPPEMIRLEVNLALLPIKSTSKMICALVTNVVE